MKITEHEIEFSPLSIKGKKALNILKEDIKNCNPKFNIELLDKEAYFIKNFYVEPFTRFKGSNIKEDKLFEDDLVDNEFDKLNAKREMLETNLLDDNIRLIWIYGTAGCGKTTYIHSFFLNHIQEVKPYFCDLEDVKRRCIIKVNDIEYEIENDELESNNCYRFALRLIDLILKYLELKEITTKDVSLHYKDIISTYYTSICNSESDSHNVREFFSLLKKFDEKNINESVKSFVDYFNGILSKKYFNTNAEILLPNKDVKVTINTGIVKLAEVLLHILLCVGYMSNRRCACIFDNLEYFIRVNSYSDEEILSDSKLEIILNSIQVSILELVHNFVNLDYVPKIVFVTRYATVDFSRNPEMDANHCVDITNWFCPKEIYEKRTDFLLKYTRQDERSKIKYKAFKYILNDCTLSKWSLAPLLSQFFNNNYRRLARILLYILNSNSNSVSRFITIWEGRDSHDQKYKDNVTHLCRMFIIRLLLEFINEIDKNNQGNIKASYFSRLQVDKLNNENNINIEDVPTAAKRLSDAKTLVELPKGIETSFTLSMLTILHRAEVEDNYDDIPNVGAKYYSFENLIRDMFLSDCRGDIKNIDKESISQLAHIIKLMNNFTDENCWVPLTSVKSEAKRYDVSEVNLLLNLAIKALQPGGKKSGNGIRITSAGQVLLMLMPEFEYYSVKYAKYKHYLLADKIKAEDGSFKNIENIKEVLKYTIASAYISIWRDLLNNISPGGSNIADSIDYGRLHNSKTIYKEKLNSNLLLYTTRLFTQQSNYLKAYRCCLDILSPKELFLKDSEKDDMMKQLNKLITLYSDWDIYFKEQYKIYFEIV